MPKVNVYLPDDLAESVKELGLPVSAICQRALEQSVKRVTAIRSTVLGDLSDDDPTARLTHFTDRARTVLKLAITSARERGAPRVGTEHLLGAIIGEGQNLGVRLLRALDVDTDHLTAQLTGPAGPGSATRFSDAAANALELTVTEALSLGHNYIGCEHLLLGLLAEPDGTAGAALRGGGAELKSVRQTVVAALSGAAHLQGLGTSPATVADTIRTELRPILTRLTRLETHTGLTDPQ